MLLRPVNLFPALEDPPNEDVFLFPPNPDGLTDFNVGVAVIVGVKSARVIVVALPSEGTLALGLKVGLFLDANGIITGVNEGFFVVNVKRDFFLDDPSSSSSTSSDSWASVVVSGSATELSITSGVGLIIEVSGVVVPFVSGTFVVESVLKVLLSSVIITESPEITATCEKSIFLSVSGEGVLLSAGLISANRLSIYVPTRTVGDAADKSGNFVGLISSFTIVGDICGFSPLSCIRFLSTAPVGTFRPN